MVFVTLDVESIFELGSLWYTDFPRSFSLKNSYSSWFRIQIYEILHRFLGDFLVLTLTNKQKFESGERPNFRLIFAQNE